jgi:hypothetical protein
VAAAQAIPKLSVFRDRYKGVSEEFTSANTMGPDVPADDGDSVCDE